ncbi:hypothetical protein PVAP13_6KG302818 [Panicum virgatum]|uniref:Uncharacterized protein n=1 Tax=Panicum virgatum TaxID=38727 RepID=A0A8T0RHG6_PANVG|nr:hypothetical protein PVAP13_6KG302818 [Panicum virgatum]
MALGILALNPHRVLLCSHPAVRLTVTRLIIFIVRVASRGDDEHVGLVWRPEAHPPGHAPQRRPADGGHALVHGRRRVGAPGAVVVGEVAVVQIHRAHLRGAAPRRRPRFRPPARRRVQDLLQGQVPRRRSRGREALAPAVALALQAARHHPVQDHFEMAGGAARYQHVYKGMAKRACMWKWISLGNYDGRLYKLG